MRWGLGWVPTLSPCVFPQLHIVHINAKYRTLGEAKGHPSGLAVLGCFFQVGWWWLTGLVPSSTCGFKQSTAMTRGQVSPEDPYVFPKASWEMPALGDPCLRAPQHRIKQGSRCKLLHPTARLWDGLCPPELLALALQVSEAPNPNYNTIVSGLRNISHAGEASSCSCPGARAGGERPEGGLVAMGGLWGSGWGWPHCSLSWCGLSARVSPRRAICGPGLHLPPEHTAATCQPALPVLPLPGLPHHPRLQRGRCLDRVRGARGHQLGAGSVGGPAVGLESLRWPKAVP